MEKILVFADDDALFSNGPLPNLPVICFCQVKFEHMIRIMPEVIEMPHQGDGKLVVHQKFHVA